MPKPEAEKADDTQDDTKKMSSRSVKPEAEKADDDGLVEVCKDGVSIRVHPTCVADHQRLGWKVV